MKLTVLIAIVLRLFAVYWAVACVVGILTSIGVASMMASSGMSGVLQSVIQFAVPVVYGILAILAWIFARAISLRVVGGIDTELSFSEVTAENLYTLGVLGFGLYYSIGNLAATANWIHYLIVNRAGQALVNQQGGLSLYDVTAVIIPCVAGAAIAVLSPKIGKRLALAGHRPTTNDGAEQAGGCDGEKPRS